MSRTTTGRPRRELRISDFGFRISASAALALGLLAIACTRKTDTSPPAVQFLSPHNGDTIYAGMIRLKTQAHDNIEVTNVKFMIDGTFLDSTGLSLTDTFSVTWDATAETLDVSHLVAAEALDRAGNTARDSVLVHFKHDIPPGALSVVTTPAGAEVWIDGANTSKTSPALVESLVAGPHQVKLTLSHYLDRDTTIQVYGNQTTQLIDTLWGYAVVSGTVTWPGHGLDQHCVALLDTSHDGHGAYILFGPADATTGNFSLAARLSLPDSAYCMGFDDVNGNHLPDAGDGEGFWDRDSSHTMTTADMIRLAPGDTITGAQVVLVTIP